MKTPYSQRPAPVSAATSPVAAARHRNALLVLWLLIALYIANFTVLSIVQNAAFETSAADLGNMNQAAWYTLHHGYPADTFAGEVIPRARGHVEPAFYLLALPYALHQSANMLLLIQVIVVALGALAAYLLARAVLGSELAGLAFALVYLLTPALQAAVLTEFHPVALAAPLFLFAFYSLQQGRQARFLVFALLAMSVKEDMSLLVAMLGLYALIAPPAADRRRTRLAGFAALVIGVGWFLLTVYVIIPHFSESGANVLFERYTEVGGSPQGLLRRAVSDPFSVLAQALAPQKLRYLAGLLVSSGFLPLAAPWALLLAAPSLGINLLSNYPPMYSGLSHYSAPVVPFVIIGAIYGAATVMRLLQKRLTERRAHRLVLAALVAVALLYQTQVGFTPLSVLYRVPRVTEHNRLLASIIAQIPADAAVSVQTPLHPHVSSRARVYPFPIVNDAAYVLLDVTTRPTMHPNDLKSAIDRLLRTDGFGVRVANDGFLLLQRGAPSQVLPDEFYSAFRAVQPAPQHRVVVDFGSSLRLLGYDMEDVDEGRQPWTRLRLYWQASAALPDDLRIYPFYLDDAGNVLEDTSQRPLVAMLWYPPERWQAGETIVVETLPWPVGDRFTVAVGVARGADWSNQAARVPVQAVETDAPVRALDNGTAIALGRFERVVTSLRKREAPPPRPGTPLQATFGGEITLLGYDMAGEIAPGETVRLTLYWQAVLRPQVDYHTFAHVYESAGQVAAQDDGATGGAQPTTWWFPSQVITETRTISIPAAAPADLAPAVTIGLYRLDSGARLPVVRAGQPQADALRLPSQ